MVEGAIANAGPRALEAFATMCEVAQRFASWLGLRESISAALEYVFARWDGRGLPNVSGEEIPLSMRLLHVARDASLFLSAFDADRARAVLEERSGAAYDPRLAELAARNLDEMLAELTMHGCGSTPSTASRLLRCGSRERGSTPHSARSRRSPA